MKRVKTPTAMLRQAQHDKEEETLQLADRPMMIEQYRDLKKCTTEK
jgi:hypothetical protein